MMREIDISNKFKRDYKRVKKSLPSLDRDLNLVIQLLANDETLPERMADHALAGAWKGFRDCHIRPDLVLIYAKSPGILSLTRLGSHSDLF